MKSTLTTGQLSRATKIPLGTINNWCRSGKIQACQPMPGLRWRVPLAEAQRICALAGVTLEPAA